MTTPTALDRASSNSHFQVLVSINGVSLGAFDTRTGGGTSAEVAKHTPASAPSKRVALGGPRDTEDLTVSRGFVASRDFDLIRTYTPLVGLAEVVVTQAPRDKDGRPLTDRTQTWTGVLSSIGQPEYDSNSSDVAMFEITMICDGDVA